MTTAYICDTAYQTLNILNFRSFVEDQDADLYLCDFFPTAEMLYRKLLKAGIFRNVILTIPHYRRDGEGHFHWYLRHAWTYLFPECTLKRDMREGGKDPHGYGRIVTCSMNHIAVSLLAVNKEAELILVDDGAGSYYSDPASDSVSGVHRLFQKIFHAGAHMKEPSAIYLYRSEHSHTGLEVRMLPKPDDQVLAQAEELFGSSGMIKTKKIIWLTQPDEYEHTTQQPDEKIREILSDVKDEVLVRRHPRDDRMELYEGFLLDDPKAMWEIQIPHLNADETILLGVYSTAQMTPKQLYDLEPKVIFLYRLYQGILRDDWIAGFQRAVEEFRETYQKKERIIIPESWEELRHILNQIVEEMK